MFIRAKGVNINYVQYGKGKDIILLHGWGQNIDMMEPLGQRLKHNFRITIIDFPGFGKSDEPTYSWTVYDYYDALCAVIKALKIKKPTIIGHSFGGRIAIIYASRRHTNKLVLLASPFHKSKEDDNFKLKVLKFMKRIPVINKLEHIAKKYIGSNDYRRASITMREILVNAINEDLTNCAKEIKCPTLLIWGSEDTEVSLEDARELESLIKDSALIVYDGYSHYAYLENLNQTIAILNSFLDPDKESKV